MGLMNFLTAMSGGVPSNSGISSQDLQSIRRMQDFFGGLSAAGAPSEYPVSFGQAWSQAQKTANDSEQEYLNNQLKNQYMMAQMEEQKRKASEPMKVGAGETLYDPKTGQAVYTSPNKGLTDYQMMMMQNMQDKKVDQRNKDLQGQSERYSKQLESTGLSELVNAADLANAGIPASGDIPGYGSIAGAMPDWAVSQAGRDTRQSISQLKNAILKARSGGAVTPQEAERMNTELGEGLGRTDDQLRTGIGNVTQMLNDKLQNTGAGYDPEAIALYQQNGGNITPNRLQKYVKAKKPDTGAIRFLGYE